MRIFFQKYWEYIILAIIVALAAFIRLFHFHGWMHFEMDQARDAELVGKALQGGIGELPLLGPRAAGTFLRLGPLFYYLQYFSAKLFHSTNPSVMAYPDLLSSILAVPLFFLFLRLYFKRFASLLGTAMFASSFIAIQYSRFAWNPNSIPFWTLFAFYGLLRAVSEEKKNRRYFWIVMAIVGWGVVSQLHFVTFLAVPAVFLFFLLWTRGFGKIGWKGIVLGAVLILIFLAPMILSDIKTSGDNAKQFIWAFRNKPNDSSFLTNLKINALSQARYYTTILTSYSSKTGQASLLAGILLVLAGGVKIIFDLFQEKDEKRKNFLKLILLWGIFSFLILIPFATQIRSRYMLFAIFLPFVLFAFLVEWLSEGKKYRRLTKSAAIIAVLAVILLNSEATFAWYRGMARSEDPAAWNNRKLDIKQTDGVTLGQLETVADHIYQKWSTDRKKIYLYARMQYRAPIAYLLESRDKKINVSFISYRDDDREAAYWAVTASEKGYNSMPPHYRAKFDVTGEGSFERLKFFDLVLKEIQPAKEDKKKLQDEKYRDLPSQTERNTKKGLKRQERVLWENLF
jgi:hypothetical protein